MVLCKKCNYEKPESEFYLSYLKSGRKKCKSCILTYNRTQYLENSEYKEKRKERYRIKKINDPTFSEKLKKNSDKFYKSKIGRAKTLLKGINDRQPNNSITLDFILKKLEIGKCEVTGIPFDFEKHPVYSKNPKAPSVDRINSKLGYTEDNVRLVIWQFNMAKGESTDLEFMEFCKKVCDSDMKG